MPFQVLALVSLATFAAPIPFQPHNECLSEIWPLLEASGESAEVVAAATVSACIPTERSNASSDSLYATMPMDKQQAVVALQRELDRENVLLKIVRFRACKRTSGCNTADMPE